MKFGGGGGVGMSLLGGGFGVPSSEVKYSEVKAGMGMGECE